jgi:hypothetical protein
MNAAMTDAELLATALRLEPRIRSIVRCTRCEATFTSTEPTWPRVVELTRGVALVRLCDGCNDEIPAGSAAALRFRDWLERTAKAHKPKLS